MTRRQSTVPLGFQIGSGDPVHVPLAHTFVTGQTQLSGKTTTLRAIVVRSGLRALAFITKRGEQFDGRRIRPYLPREGTERIHWRLVETILASALGQRNMKYERYWIVNAAKNARSLQGVRDNVARLRTKAKGTTAETYELIGEYLDLVLPEMRELNADDQLDLQPGLNVIDVAGHSQQLQAMVIRACLEQINKHESEVLTVFPEAWEFAPRGRKTPASDEAVAMARKGAVLGNLLLCDSQDIAGVDTAVRQAASVWILGVQRELNELRRTLQMIPGGIKKPKPDDVTSLKVGEFIACWQGNAIRTYVQPVGMTDADAIAIARGERSVRDVYASAPASFAHTSHAVAAAERKPHDRRRSTPAASKPTPTAEDDEMAKEDIDRLERSINNMGSSIEMLVRHLSTQPAKTSTSPGRSDDRDDDIDAAPASANGPAQLKLNTTAPELTVNVAPLALTAEESSPRGRVATLIAEGFFQTPRIGNEAFTAWKARGFSSPSTRIYEALDTLVKDGFLIRVEKKKYQQHPNLTVNRNGKKTVTLTINYK